MTGEWKADPTGRHHHRWWDGTGWTDQVSDSGHISTDPMSAVMAPSAPPRKKAKWPWVLGGLLAAFAVLVVGCVAVVGFAINEAVNELNEAQQRHAITQEQFDAIPIGASRAEVVAALGKEPQSAQEFVSEGIFDEDELRSGCIYYNRDGELFGHTYQFCFEGDSLRSKNSYG